MGALLCVAAALALAVPPAHGFEVGVTHTQWSLDPWGDPGAVARGKAILATVGPLQNQHIMGWGVESPEPRPGHFDWSGLDARMATIRETGGTPVITLCCAPDWMKGGHPGRTDWERLEVAPRRTHFDAFARLAVRVAKRYRDARYFQVWNELKGFWNRSRNRWAYKRYTELYNRVYDALKRFDPTLRVGGPYAPISSFRSAKRAGRYASGLHGPWGVVDRRSLDAVRYWLSHKHGADFVDVDGSTATDDGFPPRPAVGAQKFATVTRWLRSRTALPIWWSEFYTADATPAEIEAALEAMRDAGATVALFWGPQCSDGKAPCLWTSTETHTGGQPTAYLPVVRRFVG